SVDGFVADGGQWRLDGYQPQAVTGPGDVAIVPEDPPVAGYAEEVFIDGAPLRQVLSRGEVGPGTFYVEQGAGQLFLGDDPAGRNVSVANLDSAVYFNGANDSRLLG